MFNPVVVHDGVETIAGAAVSMLDDQYQTAGGVEDFDPIRIDIEHACLSSIDSRNDDWIGTAIDIAYNIYTHVDGECTKYDFVSFVRSNLDQMIGDSNA